MKIGIFGGTFDPIHIGHLRSAVEVGESLALKTVYIMPAASPPHKEKRPITPFHDRFEMVQRAVAENPLLEPLDLEAKRPGLSYSIETLRALRGRHDSEDDLYFILGMDAFMEIETWKEFGHLFEYAHFVVLRRPGVEEEGDVGPFLKTLNVGFTQGPGVNEFVHPSGNRIILQSVTLLDISSTRVRRLVGSGHSIRYLVPGAVASYIKRRGLYRHYGNP